MTRVGREWSTWAARCPSVGWLELRGASGCPKQPSPSSAKTVAQVAGIQAAKRTSELIPLCHPLVLDKIDVQLRVTKEGVNASCEVGCVGRTGAEMEALTAVSAALLTVYDMCKAVDSTMEIGGIHLVEKTKSDVEQL